MRERSAAGARFGITSGIAVCGWRRLSGGIEIFRHIQQSVITYDFPIPTAIQASTSLHI
jgi:hypothetical protein